MKNGNSYSSNNNNKRNISNSTPTTKIKITNYSICNAKNLIISGRVNKQTEYKITSGGISTTTDGLTETCSGINVINIITPKSGNLKCEGKLLKISEGITNRVNIMKLYDSTFSKNKNKEKIGSSSKSNKN
jgi:hypothetical protein